MSIRFDPKLSSLAQNLTGHPSPSIEPVKGGGNNRFYKITTDRQQFGLKFYLQTPDDPRDRQQTESTALTFLNARAFPQVVKLHKENRDNHCSLMEWIEGSPPAVPYSSTDVDQVLRFVEALYQAGTTPQAQAIPLASASCLSGFDLEIQLYKRLERLKSHLPDHPELAQFIQAEFTPFLKKQVVESQRGYQSHQLDFFHPIPLTQRILSPSDFGFHNSIRRLDGRLVFLDFEYFGWDDPCKMTCDFLLHPGMNIAAQDQEINSSLQSELTGGIVDICRIDPTLSVRIEQLYPLYGLCWCLIILNEFLPQSWTRRERANPEPRDQLKTQDQQLKKARRLLLTLRKTG
ncbi:MAG: phosphotransferase [Magnetococcales bacterium]|nr:phosphotransferase [Magnetococcales bacterium]